jgi:hypothetical protein
VRDANTIKLGSSANVDSGGIFNKNKMNLNAFGDFFLFGNLNAPINLVGSINVGLLYCFPT